MATNENLELLDFTIGLYEQALKLLEPGSDDFSILSGCILLSIGLEKLIKSVLHTKNPLMILYKKLEFEDLVEADKGKRFENQATISFEVALKRLVFLFPPLAKEAKDIEDIVKERNFLMHNFGYIDIGKLEKKVQTKVADISGSICTECFKKSPEDVFGKNIWNKMTTIRKAYRQADILEFEQRVRHLKRLFSHGETLPCKQVEIPKELEIQSIVCPVCENNAEVAIDWDIDVDHREGILLNAWPYFSLVKCQCGFAMQDPEEIEIFMEQKIDPVPKDGGI